MAQLTTKIAERRATVAIIGLGYVGLPLAVAFAEAGFPVVGIDVDASKVDALNAGHSYISDIPSSRLQRVAGSGQPGEDASPGHLTATTDFAALFLPVMPPSSAYPRP